MRRKNTLRSVMAADARKIQYTYEHMDEEVFSNAVRLLGKAKHIYVIGLRNCAPLAQFLSFYLNLIFDNVKLLQTNSASELLEQMIHIGERDVVVGISFPRYSMRTLKALEFANHRKAQVITITDAQLSPINLYSSCRLVAKSDMTSIADSLVAPMSLINALIVSLCANKKKKVLSTLEELETVWDDYQTFGKDEIEPVEENPQVNLKPEERRNV